MTDTPRLLIERIGACLAGTGSGGWAAPFTALAAGAGAAQVMVFSYTAERAGCLLSRNFRTRAAGTRLARNYLEGWYREDPLYRAVLEAAPGELRIVHDSALAPDMSARYRARFFTEPDFTGKSAIIAAGQRLRLIVNLYHASGTPAPAAPPDDPLLPLLGRLALLHFEAPAPHGPPAPLMVLSERERAVCMGILSGRKAELIAADLGVAASSVVTYRARAYAKLGISSRGALFAICGGGAATAPPGP